MKNAEVLDFAKKEVLSEVSSVRQAQKEWNGYKVYLPILKEPMDIGLPHIILEKDKALDLKTGEEVFKIIDYAFPDDE